MPAVAVRAECGTEVPVVMPLPGSRGGKKGLTEPSSANTEKEMSYGNATREILESSRIG